MTLYVLTFLAGALTILSPCILPVLPFVFTRVGKPFATHGLPMLIGMALMFAGIASLTGLGGGWVVATNHVGRVVALALMGAFGLTLLIPALADRINRPFVQLGGRWSQAASKQGSWGGSLLLGMATGLLWAPCAGPILGLVLTGAALRGGGIGTSLLLFAYGGGAACSLAMALLLGDRVFAAMKRSIGVGEKLRQVMGVLVIFGVVMIASGLDTGLLANLSLARTNQIEQGLMGRFDMVRLSGVADNDPADSAIRPSLAGAVGWFNSPPLTMPQLKGKVVLVDFWTYSCINCLRSLPYVTAWAHKYKDAGLVVIGVHTPEFAFEKDPGNIAAAVKRFGIIYPVANDSNYAIWQSFNNQYWPADYLIDGSGRVRADLFGEGGEAAFEAQIQKALAANGAVVPGGTVDAKAAGVQQAASSNDNSPETYIGTDRAESFAGRPAEVTDRPISYTTGQLETNQWGLDGLWQVSAENGYLLQAGGRINFRFQARDLHLVLGPGEAGQQIRFQVSIDGHAPGADHGVDTDAAGNGVVDAQRLYQLVRMNGGGGTHLFTIEFRDKGVDAYSFTFG